MEAYIGEDDRASHARFGRTARNEVMYAGPGLAYVYLVYGMYHCLNVVTEPAGRPAAVLIRAVEPLAGFDAMRRARVAHIRRSRKDPAAADVEAARVAGLPAHRLAAGPGLVGAAFTLGREHTGLDLCEPGSAIRLEPAVPADRRPDIVTTARVGIAYAGVPWTRMPWRFVDARSPAISGLRTRRTRRSAPDRM